MSIPHYNRCLSPVLFVGDLFHPINGLAVQNLRNGDVRHGRGEGGTMPMFFARRELRRHALEPRRAVIFPRRLG